MTSTRSALAVCILLVAAGARGESPPLEIFGFAEGTTGGYGGETIVVTTLEDLWPARSRCPDAPCSLRHAVWMDAGPRHITFAVSGDLVLENTLAIRDNDLTIDGSTAPGGGVQITGFGIHSYGDNLIFTHLKLRGVDSAVSSDCLDIRHGTNIVVDHVSAQFCNDEAISLSGYKYSGYFYSTRNVTIQYSVIAWSQTHRGNRPFSSLITSDVSRVSYYRNLMAHNAERNPAIGAGFNSAAGRADELRGTGQFEMVENVVYDYLYGILVDNFSPTWKQEVDVIGNHFIEGPSWTPLVPIQARATNPYGYRTGPIRIYLEGNMAWSRNSGDPECMAATDRELGARTPCQGWDSFRVDTPHRVGADPAPKTFPLWNVFIRAGATRPCRDELDARTIREAYQALGRNLKPGEDGRGIGLPDLSRGCQA